jgi:hypothetical protein
MVGRDYGGGDGRVVQPMRLFCLQSHIKVLLEADKHIPNIGNTANSAIASPML